jgi:hypothetical protein
MPNDHSDWERERPRLGDKGRKPWVRMDAGEYVPDPEIIRIERRMATETAPKGYTNGRPLHIPYRWNGAERYRQMGIAMSLFRIRQRIRAAQRLMQETVTWPENGISTMQNGHDNGGYMRGYSDGLGGG